MKVANKIEERTLRWIEKGVRRLYDGQANREEVKDAPVRHCTIK